MSAIDERREALETELAQIETQQRHELVERMKRVINEHAEARGKRHGTQLEIAKRVGLSPSYFCMILKGQRDMPIHVRQWMEREEQRLGIAETAGV